MKVLVVNPPNKPFTNRSLLAEPLDALLIYTILKNNIKNIDFIDMDERKSNNDINDYLDNKNIVIFVYDYMIPLHTSETLNNIFEIIENTKKETKFIIIGKNSCFNYKYYLNNNIDIVIRNNAEELIYDVINSAYNNEKLLKIDNLAFKYNNKIITTKYNNDNKYNYLNIDRSIIDINNYMDTRTMITSKGCINHCTFCLSNVYYKKWVCKNEKRICDEIEYLINKYNTKKIIFLDDNLLIDKKRIDKLCDEIIKRNIHILFGCLSSINCYDDILFKKMYKCGFRWIHFGIESGSEKVLKMMNKKMNIDDICKIINEVKKMGYRVRTSIILDYPLSNEEDIVKTQELLLKILPHEVRLHYLAYKKGTKVYEEYKDKVNSTEYIHSSAPNIKNNLSNSIKNLKLYLKKAGYIIIEKEIDWQKYNNENKNIKIASFVPIKYGMCWYE